MAGKAKDITPDRIAKQKFERERDHEVVRGIFRFHEVPGGEITFVYKKYKEDEVERFTMRDGEIYSIPLGVAKHLNKDCYHSVHAHAVDEYGKPIAKIGKKVQRCSFESLEFMPEEDLTIAGSPIVTVEKEF